LVLSRLYMPAARPRQAPSSVRQTNGPAHFPEHPRHCDDWLRTVGVFFGLLTLPFVHSQPLWQDHLHVSQLEARPLALRFSFPAPQQAIITSASFVKQSSNSQLPALFVPEFLLNGGGDKPVSSVLYRHVIKLPEGLYAHAIEQPGAYVSNKATTSASATALVTVTLSATATASRAVLTRSLAGSCRHQLSAYWILRNQMLEFCLW